MLRTRNELIVVAAMMLSAAGCTCGAPPCDPADPGACEAGLVCEAVQGGEAACFPETAITGRIFDALSDEPIVGARVVAIDATTGGAASNVVTTGEEGTYRIGVRLARSTDTAADQTTASYTLRVDAEAYQAFPSPLRQAIPISVNRSEPDAAQSATRDVALLPLEDADPAALGSIAGVVADGTTGLGGVLVVAESSTGGPTRSTLSDASGSYLIPNLPEGTYTVSGYIAQRAFDPSGPVMLAAGDDVADVDLLTNTELPLTEVAGGIQLVNPQTTTTETTIVLALASTGEVPFGLSAITVNKQYALTGVPPGSYDILASYTNDDLVLDPDPSQLPRPIRIQLPDDATDGVLDSGNFKITGDVGVVSPGNDPIAEAPVAAEGLTLTWEDDAGEDLYGIEVFDAFGERIWGSDGNVLTVCPDVSAPRNTAELAYAGPPLIPGATYQWRVTSYTSTQTSCAPDTATSLVPIARSENLRGIFTVAE